MEDLNKFRTMFEQHVCETMCTYPTSKRRLSRKVEPRLYYYVKISKPWKTYSFQKCPIWKGRKPPGDKHMLEKYYLLRKIGNAPSKGLTPPQKNRKSPMHLKNAISNRKTSIRKRNNDSLKISPYQHRPGRKGETLRREIMPEKLLCSSKKH